MNTLVLVYIITALLGLCVGSFLNVAILRIPEGESIAFPPSRCPKCKSKIKWYDNIPLLSYLFLGGKCRNCKNKISLQYPAVELANCLLWIICVIRFWGISPYYAVICMAACSVLVCIFVIDIHCHLIFYRFQVLLFALASASMLTKQGESAVDRLIGFAAGGILLLVIYLVFLYVVKREGIGIGDIILMAASGLMVGWQGLKLLMLVSSISACIVLLAVRIINRIRDRFTEYPFAPFIVLGDLVALFFGEQIIRWYLNLFIGG